MTVFDEDFDDEKTYRFSMTEWKSLLLKTLKYEKVKMTPDIIELFKSVCEKMRKADYVEARSDMLKH